ncbi:MAG: hypothetical protein V7K32_26960 [Nostoc sp.]
MKKLSPHHSSVFSQSLLNALNPRTQLLSVSGVVRLIWVISFLSVPYSEEVQNVG